MIRIGPAYARGIVLAAAVFVAATSLAAAPNLEQWSQWRGPIATGEAPTGDPLVSWSETRNIKWKVATPGFGTSTPIVWGNQVFLLAAAPTEEKAAGEPAESGPRATSLPHEFFVLCYSRKAGEQLWKTVVSKTVPHEGHHADHGFASSSPVTDGQKLWVYFGSRGLHCLDLKGNVVWSKDLGRMRTRNSFGEGSSPALHGNTLVVFWDDETENDFIAAFDKNSGEQLWRTARNEPTGWSTPLILEHQGKAQVIVNGTRRVRSYDLKTGEELWQAGGQTVNVIPTPVASADTVYVTSGFRGSCLQAIALGRTGDLTGTEAIRWSHDRNTPYVPSPLLVENLIYFVAANRGELSCADAQTGKLHYDGVKLEGITGIYASPVSAKDRVYVLGRNGLCLVLRRGPSLEEISRNQLDDRTDASLAIAGKEIFIRGHKALYCIAE